MQRAYRRQFSTFFGRSRAFLLEIRSPRLLSTLATVVELFETRINVVTTVLPFVVNGFIIISAPSLPRKTARGDDGEGEAKARC